MLIGYARVSTDEQNLDLQRDALLKAGVSAKDIYTDKVTGVKADRPGLTLAISHLREGDTLVVWRLDRLGRSLKHLIETVTTLKERGVSFKSLTENIDSRWREIRNCRNIQDLGFIHCLIMYLCVLYYLVAGAKFERATTTLVERQRVWSVKGSKLP